jgi:pimeloyl-ACP methyl ester carboxylesterase
MATTRQVRTPDGTSLHVVLDGPDDAPLTVVFAHGWTLTHASWTAHTTAVTAADAGFPVRTIAYDQRGHGRSARSATTPVTIDMLGEDLGFLIDELAPQGPVVLAGHSMGGMTIMALAAARPELFAGPDGIGADGNDADGTGADGPRGRIAGVLLTATSAGGLAKAPRGRVPGVTAAVRRVQAAGLASAARNPARAQALWGRIRPTGWVYRRWVQSFLFGLEPPRQAVLECARMIHATPVDVTAAFYPALMAHEKTAALAALSGVPVRILCGSRDKLTPVAHARAIATALPHAVLHIETGSGHMLHTERPYVALEHLRALIAATHPAAVTG